MAVYSPFLLAVHVVASHSKLGSTKLALTIHSTRRAKARRLIQTIDTSAILAWLKHEPERERIVAALESHPVCHLSAVSLLEAHIVVRGREHPAMLGKLHRFLDEIGAVIMPFDEHQARLADLAFSRYGKGQEHPAKLNFGDCAAYALTRILGEPLLFVGDDFAQTDIDQC
ncbi:MAG: type II toxin-antitoxin system VapC family toxin [Zoogloeaceae bacterium]|jgi:ribonuclease VapC|nr:type II toxin-antitoxin system VapC family toxin [Zoogloeaceae bacterium]